MTDWVTCPQCDGRGRTNAMSGAHVPHQLICFLCEGHCVVTPEISEQHKKCVAEYDRKLRESLAFLKPKTTNIMNLDEVINEVKAEFEYAQRWDRERKERGASEYEMDRNKSVETWILWIEEYLAKARIAATNSTDKTAALEEVRKVANLALACLVYQGCPSRGKKS